MIKHEPLRYDELPTPGTLIAIDAEFVSMQQEETEYRSDGTKKVIRPARLSLARVSVLRGDGPKEGVPFIDDHIHTSEIIVDYLTEFSGIKCTCSSALRCYYTSVCATTDVNPYSSWRSRSEHVPINLDTAEGRIQEAPSPRR